MTQPTVSKALKEVVVLRIRIQSYQIHLTMLQYYNMQYTVTHKICTDQKWIQPQWNGPSETKPNTENC